jgi:hypothetical protein
VTFPKEVPVKRILSIVSACLLVLGLALWTAGCNPAPSSSPGKVGDKMESGKMGGDKMGGDKDKMGGDKMEKDKMGGDTMNKDKMDKDKMDKGKGE